MLTEMWKRFLRSPTPNEWNRLWVYAHRMIRLIAPQNDHVLSEDILHVVNLDRSGQPMLPKLQLLSWTTGRAFLPWLHLLLSPSLSNIYIDLNGVRATPVTAAVIKAIPTTHLRLISFSALHTTPEVDATLLDLVRKSERLKSIYIQQEITSEETSSPNKIEDEREPIELEGLTSIIIRFNSHFTFLSRLFDRTKFLNAQQIHIKHLGKTEWLGGNDLFDSLLRSASPGVLHALQYTSSYHGVDITSARIRSLQSFTLLRTVRITSSCSAARCRFFLSDDDISTIAFAMPNLVELYLGDTPCASTLVNVSMSSLATLAANCAKLTGLQIHFDTTGFINKALDGSTERTTPPRLAPNSCKLTQLNVGRTPLGKGADGCWTVGMALLQIFPNLKSIKHHQQLWREDGWEGVMRVIKVQRNVASLISGVSVEFALVRVANARSV